MGGWDEEKAVTTPTVSASSVLLMALTVSGNAWSMPAIVAFQAGST